MRWLAAAAAAAVLVVAIVLTFSGGGRPPDVKPVAHATTPTQQARNLEAWLRRYSR